ncbi:MAG: YHS domain-containing protein [Mesorhizobium sp.]|nr:MAG: YHS domain-containing protein [Mesorhizobium sp.]
MTHSDHHHHAHSGCCSPKAAPSVADAVIRDPVCRMNVDPAAGKPTAEHGGHLYHFCSERCRSRFTAEPENYITATDPAAACVSSVPPRSTFPGMKARASISARPVAR